MSLGSFLNAKFTLLEDLVSVDTVVKELETQRLASMGETVDSENDVLYDRVHNLAHGCGPEALREMDDLITEYGNTPLLTFTREIVVQRTQLDAERQKVHTFTELFNKIQNFETDSDDSFGLTLGRLRELKRQITSLEHNETLIRHFQSVIESKVKSSLVSSLIQELEGWDTAAALSSKSVHFADLIELQLMSSFEYLEPGTAHLWAMDCLVDSFKTKFIYHFEGQGETNRIDKPEFALTYTQTYIRQHMSLAKNILLDQFVEATKDCSSEVVPSFSSWFIASILVVLRSKFQAQMPQYKSNGRLLSHLVSQLKNFDIDLVSEFNFVPSADKEWNGLTYDLILQDSSIWSLWLSNEKEFVNARFEEIIESPNAFTIEHEVVQDGKTKPTTSAINLKNLLEGITENYSNLPLAFQMKFLSEVQLKLLNFYFNTLKNGLSALSHIRSTSLEGVSTLERICRIFCASEFIVEMMTKWDLSLVFIQLWQSLNPDGQFKSTFFSSVIKGYQVDILNKLPKILIKYFDMQLNKCMNASNYFKTNWSSLEDCESPSQELVQVISKLQADLDYLKYTISTEALIRWKSLLARNICQYFENNLLMSFRFSKQGAHRLQMDLDHLLQQLNLTGEKLSYGKVTQITHFYQTGRAGSLLSLSEIEFLQKNAI